MASLKTARRVVIKIGSALLVEAGNLRTKWLDGLARDVAALSEGGADVLLVSSGSIALGRGVLAMGGGELSLEQSQAAAAVGQIRLARAYEQALAPDTVEEVDVLVGALLSERRPRAVFFHVGTVAGTNFASFRRF
ncbi:MAG: hypothetical protein GKR99_20015 [Rhodobacteraceae bacterium]|nr:hypothetical protein [Paracoccaceae bacterium]